MIAGAICVVVVAAVAAAWPHGRSSPPAARGEVWAGQLLPVTNKLRLGMTRRQVLRRVGKPTKILRDPNGMSCWEYVLAGSKPEAVRVCFYSGVYNAAHWKYRGKWDYPADPQG